MLMNPFCPIKQKYLTDSPMGGESIPDQLSTTKL